MYYGNECWYIDRYGMYTPASTIYAWRLYWQYLRRRYSDKNILSEDMTDERKRGRNLKDVDSLLDK